jgi:hypothetical protein
MLCGDPATPCAVRRRLVHVHYSVRPALTLLAIFGARVVSSLPLCICGLPATLGKRPCARIRLARRCRRRRSRSASFCATRSLLNAPGIAAGVVRVLAFARLMKSFVHRLSPTDPVSMAAAAFVLLLAFFSARLPAERASAVDPAVALRNQ